MGYAGALEKAWQELSSATGERRFSLRLLADTYDIDLDKRIALQTSCNIPAKEHLSIILLHYLTRKLNLKDLPAPSGEWIDFKDLAGGEGYYPAFKKRTIDKIVKKYGAAPESLLSSAQKLPFKKSQTGDVGIIVDALEGVGILISIWKADEEFGPSANILFDRTISTILCTEDIVVLTEIIAHLL